MPSIDRGATWALAVTGALLADFFLGGQVPACLGPLGVTAIQCYAASGTTPTAGAGLPVSVALLGAAIVLMVGPPRDRRLAVVTAAIGAMIGGVAYLALRPTEMRGPISTGAIISIALPVDPPALAAAVLAGAFGGIVVAAVVGRVGMRWRAAHRRR